MSFPADITDKIVDACMAAASEVAAALGTALDESLQITAVQPGGPLPLGALPDTLSSPGLAIVFPTGGEAAVLLIPESTNLLPTWYVSPDATGDAKLQTLAQELSLLLFPDDLKIAQSSAHALENMAGAVGRAKLGDPAEAVVLTTTGKAGGGPLHLVWPVTQIEDLADPQETAVAQAAVHAARRAAAEDELVQFEQGIERLPGYSRSLLSIRVPLVVKLAETKLRVEQIVKLGPGAIIQFDKSFDQMLHLEAGGRVIADGEAVKVGDKFGLRISSIHYPEERFVRVGD